MDTIRLSLIYHAFISASGDIFRNRYMLYTDQNGSKIRKKKYCRIPQGSVQGFLVWKLAYDAVLRVNLPRSVNFICYADDTLVLSSGINSEKTKTLEVMGVEIVTKLCVLGLRIPAHKNEAFWFHKLLRQCSIF